MKAKKYVESYRRMRSYGVSKFGAMRAMARSLNLEARELIVDRKIQKPGSVPAIYRELDTKWRAICDREPDLAGKVDFFRQYTEVCTPELVEGLGGSERLWGKA